ncbi:MAG: response regulator [Acidimicrobiia bacterium]|nr:response regulator [Acidimicrobiia bacterium]
MTDRPAIRVLAIDDEPNVLNMLSRVLRRTFDIVTASSEPAGVAALQTRSFDIALVDYSMPHMTGVEFFEIARRIRPEMIRVAVTGYGDQPELLDAVRTGLCAEIVWKPWKAVDLEATVRRLVGAPTE